MRMSIENDALRTLAARNSFILPNHIKLLSCRSWSRTRAFLQPFAASLHLDKCLIRSLNDVQLSGEPHPDVQSGAAASDHAAVQDPAGRPQLTPREPQHRLRLDLDGAVQGLKLASD